MKNKVEGRVIEAKNEFFFIKNGIFYCIVKDNARLTIEDGFEHTSALKELSSIPLPLFIDTNTIKSQTRELREYLATDEEWINTHIAAAVLVKNPVAKIIANFFLGFSKAIRPVKLFTDENEALQWLEQFKQI